MIDPTKCPQCRGFGYLGSTQAEVMDHRVCDGCDGAGTYDAWLAKGDQIVDEFFEALAKYEDALENPV